MLKGKLTLFVSQYGDRFYAKTLQELRQQVSGRTTPMYRDKKDGTTVRVGYVIGNLWLTAFTPVEIPA